MTGCRAVTRNGADAPRGTRSRCGPLLARWAMGYVVTRGWVRRGSGSIQTRLSPGISDSSSSLVPPGLNDDCTWWVLLFLGMTVPAWQLAGFSIDQIPEKKGPIQTTGVLGCSQVPVLSLESLVLAMRAAQPATTSMVVNCNLALAAITFAGII